jgi:hypothetical protein
MELGPSEFREVAEVSGDSESIVLSVGDIATREEDTIPSCNNTINKIVHIIKEGERSLSPMFRIGVSLQGMNMRARKAE